MDKKIIMMVALAAVVFLALVFGLGLLGGQDSNDRGGQRFGGPGGFPGDRNVSRFFDLPEGVNQSEVQALMEEMREARMAGDTERAEGIVNELEELGLNMSFRDVPRNFYPPSQ
ncbi:MAG: hypothetical protein JXB14_02990 [Candidatus Altiarchaeota archaeon]|nr:hypothetical protein [Candidatus Altiarchaeota archaeon]